MILQKEVLHTITVQIIIVKHKIISNPILITINFRTQFIRITNKTKILILEWRLIFLSISMNLLVKKILKITLKLKLIINISQLQIKMDLTLMHWRMIYRWRSIHQMWRENTWNLWALQQDGHFLQHPKSINNN